MTTTGYGDIRPRTDGETYVAMFVQFVTAFIYAILVGALTSAIELRDAAAIRFEQKMDYIHHYMNYRQFSVSLRDRILSYYSYLWDKKRGADEGVILQYLPFNLRNEVIFFRNSEILEKVPLFKGCDPGFISSVSMLLKPQVFPPEDFIIVAGETGQEMYFINKGSVEVLEGEEVRATLGKGSFFGELALIAGDKRRASVRCREFCEVFVLYKEDFEQVLSLFPGYREKLQHYAHTNRTMYSRMSATIKAAVFHGRLKGLLGSARKRLIEKSEEFYVREQQQDIRKMVGSSTQRGSDDYNFGDLDNENNLDDENDSNNDKDFDNFDTDQAQETPQAGTCKLNPDSLMQLNTNTENEFEAGKNQKVVPPKTDPLSIDTIDVSLSLNTKMDQTHKLTKISETYKPTPRPVSPRSFDSSSHGEAEERNSISQSPSRFSLFSPTTPNSPKSHKHRTQIPVTPSTPRIHLSTMQTPRQTPRQTPIYSSRHSSFASPTSIAMTPRSLSATRQPFTPIEAGEQHPSPSLPLPNSPVDTRAHSLHNSYPKPFFYSEKYLSRITATPTESAEQEPVECIGASPRLLKTPRLPTVAHGTPRTISKDNIHSLSRREAKDI